MILVILYPLTYLCLDYNALWSYLHKIFEERIVILDGAMGTQLQKYKLQEEDYRGNFVN
jgi:methionine synthase I (cobalamin-dependent)